MTEVDPRDRASIDRLLAELHRESRGAVVTALGGGITNKNFRVDVGEASWVVRLGGRGTAELGIDRRREAMAMRAAAALGVGAEVIHADPEADVVVTDRLAPRSLLRALDPEVEIIDCGKSAHRHNLTQDEINAVIVDRAQRGKRVVRLKGGDPFVFGRGGEEVAACIAAGIAVQVVPGITSAIDAPAAAGIPVTHRGLAADFAVAPDNVVQVAMPLFHVGGTSYALFALYGGARIVMMRVPDPALVLDVLEQLVGGEPHGRELALPALLSVAVHQHEAVAGKTGVHAVAERSVGP